MDTFEIRYTIAVLEGEEIDQKIEDVCLEQTAELPRNVLSAAIEKNVVGEPSQKHQLRDDLYDVCIRWPLADVGTDVSQFLNLLYGNISLQPGIRVTSADWFALSGALFGGPQTGIAELRKKYAIPSRPLSATALKPLGSSPAELAQRAYQFAVGGIDIIKDDHGLANQDFAPFEERVKANVEAVRKAAEDSGRPSYYYPNVTAFASDAIDRCKLAAEFGADGVLICPHITGLETMHRLARLDTGLPVIAHPAFSGGLTTSGDRGLSPEFLYGQLWRALGADFVIYPNKGGRFSFSAAECQGINEAARDTAIPFKTSFPMPGGGIQLENLEKWISEYGKQTAFLIGGSLYEHPGGIQMASQELREKLIKND